MAGPWLLDDEGIGLLEARPGVYILGRERSGAFYGLYVGRSDMDLKRRLAEHLPGREANPFIRIYAPDRFHCEYTATASEAYRLECTLFHSARYPANLFHPDPGPHADWECPVCGGGASRVQEPILGYATARGSTQPPHG
jgi:predicted GIY-YIG superfamily endonuclease